MRVKEFPNRPYLRGPISYFYVVEIVVSRDIVYVYFIFIQKVSLANEDGQYVATILFGTYVFAVFVLPTM